MGWEARWNSLEEWDEREREREGGGMGKKETAVLLAEVDDGGRVRAVTRSNLAVNGGPAQVKDGVGSAERAHELAGLDGPDAEPVVARPAGQVVAAVAEAYPVHVVPVVGHG